LHLKLIIIYFKLSEGIYEKGEAHTCFAFFILVTVVSGGWVKLNCMLIRIFKDKINGSMTPISPVFSGVNGITCSVQRFVITSSGGDLKPVRSGY
jgi:hypothetical protein